MQLIRSPERGLCLPTSFAMALGLPVKTVLERLGHDGKEVAFLGLPPPICWRGFHIQELIHVALELGYAATPVEVFPQIAAPRYDYANRPVIYGPGDANWDRFTKIVATSRGVITGASILEPAGVVGHAVAYENGTIFNPSGGTYEFTGEACCRPHNFFVQTAWRIDRIAE